MLNYISYFNARRLEKNKQWKPALDAYKKLVKDQKVIPAKISYRIGFVAEKLQDWKTAEAWLSKAVKLQGDKSQWTYRLALSQEKNKKYAAATATYKKALKLDSNKPAWMYRCGLCLELQKKFSEAQTYYEQALAITPDIAEWHYRLGKVLWLSGHSAFAETPLRKAMELDPTNGVYAHEFSVVIRKQGRIWQETEALDLALSLDSGKAQWYFEQGEAQDKMNRFAEAAQAFKHANRLKPGNSIWHYREGYAWERAGSKNEADEAYASARSSDKDLKSKQFGVGVFHQHRGLWPQAAIAYAEAALLEPFNGELMFRLGMAHDRCYRWEMAAECYRQALVFEPHKSDWHYRLGFVLERQSDFQHAAEAYEYASATKTTHMPYWFYRLGYVLTKAGEYEKACKAFLLTRSEVELTPQRAPKALMPEVQTALSESYLRKMKSNTLVLQSGDIALHSKEQAGTFYKLGNQAERLKMWDEAANAYKQAVSRSSTHQSAWYFRLGYVQMQQRLFKDAATAFIETRVFKRPYGISSEAYQKNNDLMMNLTYSEYFDSLKVRENIILYESNQGASIGCNPWSIFLQIEGDERFKDFSHIWVINDSNKIPKSILGKKNVVFVRRDSDLYFRYLSTAKYLINNNTFPPYFVRKKEQKYLNTWHGTPLKYLGRDMIDGFMEHRNAARNFLQSTHLVSPNKHTTQVLTHGYDIYDIYGGLVAETGYPRVDRTLSQCNEDQLHLKQRLGISNDFPIVLYAPTWRGTLNGGAQFDIVRLKNDIEKLSALPCNFLFRGHHMLESMISEESLNQNLVVPSDIDTNDLLAISDVLVTDYSSILFDFLPTGRPIFLYAYDLEEYSAERGLYFSMDAMPGELCQDTKGLCESLSRLLAQYPAWTPDEKYQLAKKEFCNLEDGGATRRVVDFFFHGCDEYVINFEKSDRRSILIYSGPLMSNGISSAVLNLFNALDYRKYNVTMLVDAEDLKYPERVQRMKSIPRTVRLICRIGRHLQNIEQKWIVDRYYASNEIPSESAAAVYFDAFSLEYQRMLSSSSFDSVVNFDGYNRFWASLIGQGASSDNKIIYLHNAMHGEWTRKYPNLAGIFNQYHFYDKLISVSKSVSEENQRLISKGFFIPANKFDYCNNVVNAQEVIVKSQESLPDEIIRKITLCNGVLFVACGRLSPEKGFEKLVDAFSIVTKSAPDAQLFILGEGPLYETLMQKISSSGLHEKVHLLGYISNPFPIIKESDCFVFSSDYEGQGLVALEALILERPVISTDVVGPRSILENGEGLLVKNTAAALADAMLNFISNGSVASSFRYEEYAASAIGKFEKIVAR